MPGDAEQELFRRLSARALVDAPAAHAHVALHDARRRSAAAQRAMRRRQPLSRHFRDAQVADYRHQPLLAQSPLVALLMAMVY